MTTEKPKRSPIAHKPARDTSSPEKDQSAKAIRKWLKSNVKVGLIVAIRRSQNGSLQYRRGRVLSIRPKNFNIGVQLGDGTFSESGVTFDYAGRSWRAPEAGIQIVIPTDSVLSSCDTCDVGDDFLS